MYICTMMHKESKTLPQATILEASPWYMYMYMYVEVHVHVQATVLTDECNDGMGQLVLSVV